MVALLRDDAVALVQQDLGFRSDLSTEIVLAMRQAQQNLELPNDELPWFLLKEDATLQNNAGALGTITLPSDFIAFEQGDAGSRGALWYYDSDWIPLGPSEWQNLEQARTQNTYIGFTHYGLDEANGTIVLGPVAPTAQYTFRLRYYANATDLTSNVTNAWLTNCADALVGRAGMRIATALRDSDALAIFKAKAEAADAAIAEANYMRRYGGQHTNTGG